MDRIQLTNSAIQTVMLNVVQHVRQPQSFFMDTFFKRRIMQDAVRAESPLTQGRELKPLLRMASASTPQTRLALIPYHAELEKH